MEILLTLVLAFGAPVLIDIAKKRGHLKWLEPWFREAWVLLICFLTIYILWRPESRQTAAIMHGYPRNHRVVGYLICASAGALIFSAYWRFTERLASAPIPIASSEKPKPDTILDSITLESLFIDDFPNLFKFRTDGELVFESGEKLKIESQEYVDYAARSSFVRFYIPNTPLTFRASARIGNSVPSFLKSIASRLNAETISSGGTDTSFRNLTFTRRVFLYHDWPLTLKEKATLEDYFNTHDLDVEFRGLDYLSDVKRTRRLKELQGK
jgi:hypothetical protein